MATNNIGNHKHLTLADRAAIEHGIQIGENFTQIAQRLNKDSSTISKEIRRHLIHVPHYQDDLQKKRSECQFFHFCEKRNVCGSLSCQSLCFKCRSKRCAVYCRDFTPILCDRLKNHLTSVITVNRSGPVPMTSIFTVPIMPMTFIMRLRFLPVQVSTRHPNLWNSWISWFHLFSLKDSHYLIFMLPISSLSIVLSVHYITTLIMDILLLSIWTSPAKYAIKSVARPEKPLKTPATGKTGHTIILKNILKNIQTQML